MKNNFIKNLKKYRKIEGLSQMKLAEKCNTDASYIGQIEIGSRFPSIDLIEKMAAALAVEPYRFFMEESEQTTDEYDDHLDVLSQLPLRTRLRLMKRLNSILSACIRQTLAP